jgi:transcription elongation factor Elf1
MDIKCPYCNDEQDVDIEYDEERLIHTCDNCAKKFSVSIERWLLTVFAETLEAMSYTVEVDINDVSEAPCLNGEPDNHASKTVGTRDGKIYIHRCSDCGKRWETDKR